MRVTLIGAVLNIGANFMLIPSFGMLGAASATILAEAVVLALIVWETRDVALPPLVEGLAAALPPTALMAIVIVPWRDSLAAIPIGIATYAGTALLTRAVPHGELTALFSGLRSAASSEPRSR